ncbi:hypothetical protein PoB_004307600 [Plakobranchus ocellatus]|uniref:EGF-like domain-containing protein n=1 Tax=Plakobranchus ocellatus TaxID=259542 RepID=A0AAV4AZH8_9GAST|nr:hypothetical protein PoB_004307600 [Plakobranchus ocellatus]
MTTAVHTYNMLCDFEIKKDPNNYILGVDGVREIKDNVTVISFCSQTCLLNGVCQNGTCVCDYGWTGNHCSIRRDSSLNSTTPDANFTTATTPSVPAVITTTVNVPGSSTGTAAGTTTVAGTTAGGRGSGGQAAYVFTYEMDHKTIRTFCIIPLMISGFLNLFAKSFVTGFHNTI